MTLITTITQLWANVLTVSFNIFFTLWSETMQWLFQSPLL